MQFPESWLREFCNPPISTQELAHTLTMAGLEVEEIQALAPPFSGIVVGRIVSAAQHPNADKLRVCEVDVGQAQLLQIVCGAPNARAGIKVPCALVGAILPPGEDGKPFHIKVGKLRGTDSFGMLCSARELKLSEDHGGLLELDDEAIVGQDIRAHLQLDDPLFTLKLTPNLAHCLSVYGIAREVSALTGSPLKTPQFVAQPVQITGILPVRIDAPDLCGRFSGRIIQNVNPTVKTPSWMVDRLARCGQRSVAPLVDISNYVMFELGRPTHIFDLDKIHGGLQVRWGRAGESLQLLNGNTIEVDPSVGVIADDRQVESLAGIMGGQATAVSDTTRNIYVEAAFWWPKAVAGRSRRFNFSTDAGHRFERGVDPELTTEHIERITQLILEICGGQAGPMDDQCVAMPDVKSVTMRVARAAKVLGMPVRVEQAVQAFQRLGLPTTLNGDMVTVTAPSYRFDLTIEEDLIEELARMMGFDQLPNTPPLAPVTPKLRLESRRGAFQVRHHLAQAGYQETINYSFVEEKWERELAGQEHPIKVMNPIASQMSVMRSSLMGSLIQVLKFNLDRRQSRLRLFELGRVFMRDDTVQDTDSTVKGFRQPMRVAGLAYGSAQPLQWGSDDTQVDFFDVKGDVESLLAPLPATFRAAQHPALHPGRCAQVWLGDRAVGYVGELHPKWRQSYDLPKAPILFELDLEAVLARPVPSFAPVSKFQTVQRDLALMVSEQFSHDQLIAAVWAAPTQGWLKDVVLFDLYKPKAASDSLAERSYALRLSFNRGDATLTDVEIESTVQAIVAQLAQQLGARLRA
jgi:phenylalanyl-tRNA synthetase beta chain